MFLRAITAAALVALSGAAYAQKVEPALIYDMGGKSDRSFNQSAYEGAERFKKETGVSFREFEINADAQREQAMRNMVRRDANLIIAAGFNMVNAVKAVASEHPNVRFCTIDATVDLPNVRSYTFKEHEGSFLVGMLAAMASKTGKVGFIGGMDIPLIRNFGFGYEQGAKFANPNIEVLHNMTGTTPAAFRDPARGTELARSQFDRGADVIYAAAGATGNGVIQTAADQNKLAIGVDSNQNYMQPGKVLTSMLKRVDNAVYNCLKDAHEGKWTAGARALGVAEDGVGWALDEHNRSLVTAEMQQKLDDARKRIVSGDLKVRPYQP
ncbi:MAG TPA: BMP family ABC transporter substrate-binding protein [Azospirillaceae bacterium]|nr:BMP family ABC transporter substrate-binding protein [Azospirillaceae bacterium]